MNNILESKYKVKTISEGKELIKNLKEDRLFEYMSAGICSALGVSCVYLMCVENPSDLQAAIAYYLGLSGAATLGTVETVCSIKNLREISKDISAIQTEVDAVEKTGKIR